MANTTNFPPRAAPLLWILKPKGAKKAADSAPAALFYRLSVQSRFSSTFASSAFFFTDAMPFSQLVFAL